LEFGISIGILELQEAISRFPNSSGNYRLLWPGCKVVKVKEDFVKVGKNWLIGSEG
jgi:hypothetical protein